VKYWVTSDWHLGHENIIKYCNRPFKNVFHMDTEIIRRFNERVRPEDQVFFLGDFMLRGGKEGGVNKKDFYLNRLLCKNIVFIRGNHDRGSNLKTIIQSLVIKYAGNYIYLVHDPQYANSIYPINLVGHVHQHWKFKRLATAMSSTTLINVSVDVWDFYPVALDEVMRQYYWWSKHEQN